MWTREKYDNVHSNCVVVLGHWGCLVTNIQGSKFEWFYHVSQLMIHFLDGMYFWLFISSEICIVCCPITATMERNRTSSKVQYVQYPPGYFSMLIIKINVHSSTDILYQSFPLNYLFSSNQSLPYWLLFAMWSFHDIVLHTIWYYTCLQWITEMFFNIFLVHVPSPLYKMLSWVSSSIEPICLYCRFLLFLKLSHWFCPPPLFYLMSPPYHHLSKRQHYPEHVNPHPHFENHWYLWK